MNTWGLKSYSDKKRIKFSFTKEDCRRLQVIQNRVLRLQLPQQLETLSTSEYLRHLDQLSVHHLGAYSTVMLGARIMREKILHFLYNELNARMRFSKRNVEYFCQTSYKLNITDEGFLSRFKKLWNMIPADVKKMLHDAKSFKYLTKTWIANNIRVHP